MRRSRVSFAAFEEERLEGRRKKAKKSSSLEISLLESTQSLP